MRLTRFSGQQVVAAVIFFLLLVLPPFLSSFLLTLLTQALIYGILAMSLDIILGYTGLASLGHAAYFGLGALSFGLLLWVAFVRKRKRRSPGHSHRSHQLSRTTAAGETTAPGEQGSEPRRRRHRHRRRRSSNYPQNPTLAQTGGLPPIRRDEPPTPAQPTGTQPP